MTTLAVSGTNLFAGFLFRDTVYGFTGGGVYRSTDNGTSWKAVNNGIPRHQGDTTAYRMVNDLAVTPDGLGGTYLFAGIEGSGVFRSTNNGTDWSAVNTGIARNYYDTTQYSDIAAFAVSPNGAGGTNLFAGAQGDYGAGVFLSTNNGANWIAVNNGLPRNPYDTTTYRHVGELAVVPDGRGGTNLFAAFWFGDVYGAYGAGVYRSTDNGTSWTAPNVGLGYTLVEALAASPDTAGGTILFAGWAAPGPSGGVLRSTDNGTTWTAASSGLPTGTSIWALAVTPAGPGGVNLLAGVYGAGVYRSTNNGMSWTDFNTGLKSTTVRVFAVSHNAECGTDVFAGTDGNGIWRRSLEEVTSTRLSYNGGVPEGFVLDQNYPNPFNPSTTIRYALPTASGVSLVISNTLGQHIATLVQGVIEAGYHEVQFDASGLAGGVYLYRLRAGDVVKTKRLVLMK